MVLLENILNLKGVVSIVAGSTLQWSDFALFGSLAPIIGRGTVKLIGVLMYGFVMNDNQ